MNRQNRVIRDLGFAMNIEVLSQKVELTGRRVIDIGCGGMTFSKLLAEAGAQVLAIDPDPIQAEKNHANPIPSIEFQLASAEQLPVSDQALDGVFFSYSLHHIPATIYEAVFAEVRRVLKPDGFLYVIEPTDCPLNQIMRLFNNEDAERAAAQAALWEIAEPMFEIADFMSYHGLVRYETFDEFVAHFGVRTFNTYEPSDVDNEVVRAAYEKHGAPDFEFESPKIAAFFSGLRTGTI